MLNNDENYLTLFQQTKPKKKTSKILKLILNVKKNGEGKRKTLRHEEVGKKDLKN